MFPSAPDQCAYHGKNEKQKYHLLCECKECTEEDPHTKANDRNNESSMDEHMLVLV